MAQVIALARAVPLDFPQADFLRAAVVYGCALALIFAKSPLPF